MGLMDLQNDSRRGYQAGICTTMVRKRLDPEAQNLSRWFEFLEDDGIVGLVVRVPHFYFQIISVECSEHDGWVVGVVIWSYVSPLSREEQLVVQIANGLFHAIL